MHNAASAVSSSQSQTSQVPSFWHLDILGSKATPLAGTDPLILSLTPQRTLILFTNLKCFNGRHNQSYEKICQQQLEEKGPQECFPLQ